MKIGKVSVNPSITKLWNAEDENFKLKQLLKKYKKLFDDVFDFLIADLDETYQEDLGYYIDRYEKLKNQEKEVK